MAIYSTNDIVRVRGVGLIIGEPFENVWHFRMKQNIITIDQLRNALVNNFLLAIKPIFNQQCRYIGIYHKKVRPEPTTEEVLTPLDPIIGSFLAEAMPHQMAILIKLGTGLEARAGRGRFYVPGWATSQWVNGLFSNSFRSTLDGQMTSILTRVGIGGSDTFVELGVVSHQSGEGDDLAYNGVTSVTYGFYPAVMRSRRPHVP